MNNTTKYRDDDNDRHAAPTWKNQLWQARRLAEEKGLEALNNPHAMTGRKCGCRDCFCCAALAVYDELKAKAGVA